MPGKFTIVKTPKGFYRFTLYASNHQVVLMSENYTTLRACREGIQSIQKNAFSQVEDQTLKTVEKKGYPKYEVYLDKAEQYRFRLLARNGQIVGIPEAGYASKSGCLNGIEAVGRAAPDAEIDESALSEQTSN